MSLPHADQIDLIIQQDTEACEALIALLKNEQNALTSRKHQDLEGLVKEKNTYIKTMEANAAKRRQMLSQADMPDTAQSWDELLSRIGSRALLGNWQKLKKRTEQCQRLNELNGKLIAKGQQTMQSLLNILRGQTANPGLYTPSGCRREQGGGSLTTIKA